MTPVFPLPRGDIILVPFSFTDLSGQKVRPALIISPNPVGNDILLAFIPSVIPATPEATDYVLDTTHPAFP
ncbi:MAG: type II toxin-antitoxin system PemK/MazF family toxin [Anaerolineae bacterium]|nr:type II toxin-antitoxin system PemK/MazF family toxin [Anaerolineae bacterium]